MSKEVKNIIITGVSRGIGYELFKLFVKEGHRVLGVSRNLDPLQPIVKEFENASILSIDISKEEELQKVKSFVEKNWQKVDVLIHNAGKLLNKPFTKTSTTDFMEVYKVNVFAVAELTRVLLDYFSVDSHVVAISSMGGIQGSMKFPGLAAYSSSKGAVITLMELLAEELKDKKIACNTLALGAVQTEMLAEAFPDYVAPVTAKEMAVYIKNFALTGQKYYNGKVLQVSSSTP